jgi:hypothetical protein
MMSVWIATGGRPFGHVVGAAQVSTATRPADSPAPASRARALSAARRAPAFSAATKVKLRRRPPALARPHRAKRRPAAVRHLTARHRHHRKPPAATVVAAPLTATAGTPVAAVQAPAPTPVAAPRAPAPQPKPPAAKKPALPASGGVGEG